MWSGPRVCVKNACATGSDPQSDIYCEFSALRSHFVVGVKAPANRRRNGATRLSALWRHFIGGVMAGGTGPVPTNGHVLIRDGTEFRQKNAAPVGAVFSCTSLVDP